MPLHLIIVFFVLCTRVISAADEKSNWFYRAWQTEDGLPDNSISAIAQSPDGYLWVGTNGGVIQFNGHAFTSLPLREIPNLPSQQVHSMFLDRSGNIWMGLERGPVIRLGPNSYRAFRESEGISKKKTTGIVEDHEGHIWISYTSGACKIMGDNVTQFSKKERFPTARQSSIVCDSDGQLWMASDSTLGKLDDSGFTKTEHFKDGPIKIAAAQQSGLWIHHRASLLLFKDGQKNHITNLPPNITVTSLFEDRQGAIWIGTQQNGLLRFHDHKTERIPTSHPSISYIMQDRDDHIWAGTNGGGLNLILPQSVNFIDSGKGLPFSSVRSTTCDSAGTIWATSLDGQIAYRERQQWHAFKNLPAGFKATCITSDRDHLWVGTRNHGLLKFKHHHSLHFEGKSQLAKTSVRSILPAKNGDLWVATTQPDQLHRLKDGLLSTIQKPFNFKAIRAITEGSDGSIRIGTADGHLLRVDGEKLVDDSLIDGPLNLSIRTLHSTPDGSLWIGYAGYGLGHLKEGIYHKFTTEKGLHDNYISQIEHDDHGNLWIASNRGLFKVSLANLLSESGHLFCHVYGRHNGLPSIQPSRDYAPVSARNASGQLFFSTHSGLLAVTPNDPNKVIPPPPIVVEKITLDGEPIAIYKTRSILSDHLKSTTADLSKPNLSLKVPADHNSLTVSFAALSLATPENTLIRYRLQPMDKKWREAESNHRVSFPRLPAGNYHLEIIASNGAGDWTKKGASIRFYVKPFFWETWWFKCGIGLFTALAAGGLVFLSLKRKHRAQVQKLVAKQALEQERSRIARDIHDDLGASLTRISLLSQSVSNSPDQAYAATMGEIKSTTRDLMRSMDGVVWAISPENDKFDDLANYLSSYAQEFLSVAGTSCRLIFPVDLPDRQLSAQLRHNLLLAFKEALNNIVKYAAATEVRISLTPEDDSFTLQVSDNGTGIDPETPANHRLNAGNGLVNMKSRMDEIGGTCLVQSSSGEGTTIEFKVPFQIPS